MSRSCRGSSKLLLTVISGLVAAISLAVISGVAAQAQQSEPTVFINEFHYDNEGVDTGEFIEVAGPAGTTLDGYSLVLYNGNDGAAYDTRQLSGTIPDQQNGYGTVSFDYPSNGIQNGAPDGIALDGPDGLAQFMSYEGAFTASGGPADGVTSDDVGVAEIGSEPAGQSLQLEGNGQSCDDFSWTGPAGESPGGVNAGQDFSQAGNGGSCATGSADGSGGDSNITPIHEIQGGGQSSPLEGQDVTIEGVVTGFDDEVGQSGTRTFPGDRGIFVQEEIEDEDGDDSTSEGLFVGFVEDFTRLDIGDTVRVNGEVAEQFDFTIIEEEFGEEPETVPDTVARTVEIDVARSDAQSPDTRDYYESLEGMLVRSATSVANVGGTNKFEELFLTPGPEKDRLIRPEEDTSVFATDADAGAGNPSNPGDPRGPKSTTVVDADMLDTVTGLEGPLAFSFGNYKVMVQEGNLPSVVGDGAPYPYTGRPPDRNAEFPGLREFEEDQIRVATFNVLNFFPEEKVEAGNYESEDRKRARIVDAVNSLLERPDVIGVQEVNNKEILDETAEALGGYEAHWFQGNDRRNGTVEDGIASGLLVKDTVTASNARLIGKDQPDTSGVGCSDTEDRLFDRPPLAADIEAENGLEFTVFVNHFSSKAAPNACRNEQARFARTQAQQVVNDGTEAIILGDLNAFEDEPALEILQETGEFENLWEREEPEQRYSFSFQGRLQTLDHVLISAGLQPDYDDFQYAHISVDYFERVPPDGHALTDHDPAIVTLDDEAAQTPDPNRCTITGTPGNDFLRGTPGRDVICGRGGNDILYGLGGKDTLRGGPGNDILRGGPGADKLIGGPGDDQLEGQGGRDRLNARDRVRGNDIADGGSGRDRCVADPRDIKRSCP
ncbi:MAG: endonuclease/exonuclease/phosphatase family protein [Rubrobacteraceae bacterium]